MVGARRNADADRRPPSATRRRALLQAHYAAENAHDLDAHHEDLLAATPRCSTTASRSPSHDSIRCGARLHRLRCGGGAFAGIRDRHRRTSTSPTTRSSIEGRLCGTHVGEFQGFAPTGRDVELPFVAFYRFDAAGKLASERVVMNLGPLGARPAWQPAE